MSIETIVIVALAASALRMLLKTVTVVTGLTVFVVAGAVCFYVVDPAFQPAELQPMADYLAKLIVGAEKIVN